MDSQSTTKSMKRPSAEELSSVAKRTKLNSIFSNRGRLEDIFQDEICKTFVKICDFKEFARSSNGLCLSEEEIQNIVEDYSDSVKEQKMGMLNKWKEKNPEEASATKICSLVRGFQSGNPEDYISLDNGRFGVFKNVPLCEGGNVFLGEQNSELYGSHFCAIKLFPYDEKNLREAAILSELRNNDNVVSILDAGICRGTFNYIYIVMELSWEKHLRRALEDCKRLKIKLPDDIAIEMAVQVLKALVFIHNRNIIHRDLKPENVLVSEDMKRLKLTDFGISKTITKGPSTKQTNKDVGTDGYRAPETYNSDIITQKSDIFSAGILLAEIFSSGSHPYGDDSDLWRYNIKKNKGLDLSRIHVSPRGTVEKLLERMLQLDPEKRPTAEEVLKVLTDLQNASKPWILDFGSPALKDSPTPNGCMLDEDQTRMKKSDSSLEVTDVHHTSPVQKANAIVTFSSEDMHLYSLTPSSEEWSRMQQFPTDGGSTVLLHRHIYSIKRPDVHRLKYSDPSEEWIKVADLNRDHGYEPSTAVFNDSIYVCGGSYPGKANRLAESYEERNCAWMNLPALNVARYEPCMIATKDHIYCMGGKGEDRRKLSSVERFDGKEWENVKSSPRGIAGTLSVGYTSATILDDRIYVADDEGVLCYDTPENSWNELNLSDQWPFVRDVKIFTVNDALYLIGGSSHKPSVMYLLDPETEQMSLVREVKKINVHSSLAVNL